MARNYNMQSTGPVQDEAQTDAGGLPFSARTCLRVVPVVLAVGIVIAGASFGIIRMQEHREDAVITRTWEEFRELAGGSGMESVPDEAGEDISVERGSMCSSDPMKRVIDWDRVYEVNSDVRCWIYIPQTEIDYPVLQPQSWSENQYYLKHDVYGSSSAAGSIYMPAQVEGFEDRDMHLIMIGHNMRNGSMFSDLVKYKDKSFWEATPYVYLYYPDRTEKWLIYSSYHTKQSDEIYNMPYEAGTVLYQELLDRIEAAKSYDTATNGPAADAMLLTLTTCDRNSTEGSDGRFVVNAKLVETAATALQPSEGSMNGESSFTGGTEDSDNLDGGIW